MFGKFNASKLRMLPNAESGLSWKPMLSKVEVLKMGIMLVPIPMPGRLGSMLPIEKPGVVTVGIASVKLAFEPMLPTEKP